MSPVFSKKLGVHPNLEGSFLINVNFCKRDSETGDLNMNEFKIIEMIEEEMEGIGIGQIGMKRKNKQKYKKDKKVKEKDDKNEEKDLKKNVKSGWPKGAEQII